MAETFSVAGPARIQLALPQALETALRTTLDAAGIGHARIDTAALFAEPPAPLAKLPLVVAARDGLVAGTERPLAEAGILSKTAPVIVILDDDALDGAISIMDIEGVELAAWPLGAEDILSILERIDIGQGYAAGVREKGPDAFVQIGMLSDEVSRIADQLARLASMKDGPVLPAAVTRRVAIEAGATQSWWKYVGLSGRVLGIDSFGASGKAADLYKHFGLTPEKLQAAVIEQF